MVVLRKGEKVHTEALVNFSKEHLARYKTPKQVHIVSELPLSTMGKILRREVRRILKQQDSV